VARFYALFGEDDAAVAPAEESLRLAETLQRDDLRAKNLITLGTASMKLPSADPDAAVAHIRAGIELAAACGDFGQLSRGYVNLSAHLMSAGELAESESFLLQAKDMAHLRGHVPGMRFVDGNLIDADLALGRWGAGERRACAFLAASGVEGHYMDSIALSALSVFELARDQLDDALQHADAAIASGRKVRDPQALVPALAMGAFVYAEVADAGRATALLEEIDPVSYIASIPLAFFAAVRLGVAEEFRATTSAFLRGTPWDRGAEAVLDGRWSDAAREYAEMGAAPFAAFADLRAADSHSVARSLQFWRSVGASRFIREAEALLAKSA